MQAEGIARLILITAQTVQSAAHRYLVREARALGLEVIDRCNLTVLQEPGQEDLPQFLAAHQARWPGRSLRELPSNVHATQYPMSALRFCDGRMA